MSNFQRGERQKETTDQYRENWERIFGRKRCIDCQECNCKRDESNGEG